MAIAPSGTHELQCEYNAYRSRQTWMVNGQHVEDNRNRDLSICFYKNVANVNCIMKLVAIFSGNKVLPHAHAHPIANACIAFGECCDPKANSKPIWIRFFLSFVHTVCCIHIPIHNSRGKWTILIMIMKEKKGKNWSKQHYQHPNVSSRMAFREAKPELKCGHNTRGWALLFQLNPGIFNDSMPSQWLCISCSVQISSEFTITPSKGNANA